MSLSTENLILLLITIVLYLYIFYKYFNLKNKFTNTNAKKIAFMFLIYDEINHEKVWEKFFEEHEGKYNIYIHYKNNVPSKYFDKYKLKHTIPTEWGHKSLVQAHNMLLTEALKDESNTHFILVSNSCVPFKTFDHIYNSLDDRYSYYNMFVKHNSLHRGIKAQNIVGKDKIKKAHQWSILNRKHAQLLVDNESVYIDWFSEIPDEHAHITFLFSQNLNNELIMTYDEKEKATTYTNWSDDGKQLANYNYISDDFVDHMFSSPCFFGRKFLKECKFDYLITLL